MIISQKHEYNMFRTQSYTIKREERKKNDVHANKLNFKNY